MRGKYSIKFLDRAPQQNRQSIGYSQPLVGSYTQYFRVKKKDCDYGMFNKRAAVPPNHEPNFRPDKTLAEVLNI